jgi:hypothetical protein
MMYIHCPDPILWHNQDLLSYTQPIKITNKIILTTYIYTCIYILQQTFDWLSFIQSYTCSYKLFITYKKKKIETETVGYLRYIYYSLFCRLKYVKLWHYTSLDFYLTKYSYIVPKQKSLEFVILLEYGIMLSIIFIKTIN